MDVKISCILVLILVSSVFSSAQNKRSFNHLTVENGLSQSSVLSITQDSTGFMWFGTKEGLNKYDSQQFEIFRNNVAQKNSISSGVNINALLTDSKGRVWIGTQDGLNQYISTSNSFISYKNQKNNPQSLSNNTIRYIYEDKQANIWVGTENGLNKLLDDGKFQRFLVKNPAAKTIVHQTVKAIYQDSESNIWVGTLNGLLKMIPQGKSYKFEAFFHNANNENSIASNDVNAIIEDTQQNIWIGTHFNGLDLYNPSAKTFTHITAQKNNKNSLLSNTIRKIIIDKQGKLWIATINGISIYDPENKTFSQEIHDPENQNSINQNSIYDIYQDKSGSVWVGTYYGGINVYHPNAVSFKTYQHYSYKNSVSSNVISAITEDQQNNLWIGTEAEGLNYYNRKTGLFTNFKSNGAKNTISSNLIKAISVTKKGNLWIAAYESGVDFFNTTTQTFKNYKLSKTEPNNLAYNRATYLYNDAQERLWVASKGKGLFLYQPKTDDFQSLSQNKSPFYLAAQNIGYLFQDKHQTLWVATDEGVFYLSKGSLNFKQFNPLNSSFFNNVSSINQVGENQVWFGSVTGGLAYFDGSTKKVYFLTTKNILVHNKIAGIVEDNDGNVWISTDKGLLKYHYGNFKIYNRSDGLKGNVFNNNSFFKDSKGELFFGGYNGMVSILPKDIIENETPPNVVFTNLRLANNKVNINDDSELLSEALNSVNELVFTAQQNVFSIDFAALNFIKAGKNKYAYKLDGLDKEWNYIKTGSATFNNLPSGTYTLLVKAANNDGVWNSNPRALKIIIKPPFWKSIWAFLLYTILLAGIFYLVNRYLLIRALMKNEHELHQTKLDFFTNVSHEIRTPLTLIIGPLEKLINDTKDNFAINRQLLTVNKNANRLLHLINELMDFRKVEAGKMKLNIAASNIVTFVEEIFLSFSQLANQKAIDYTFTTSKDVIEVYYDSLQLEKVIFNLLSNAFKFVTQKNATIKVIVTNTDKEVFISVFDNGEGIPAANKNNLFTDFYQIESHQKINSGTGIGLAFSKSLAKLHQGDLILEEDTDLTCFKLVLPLGTAHLNSIDIKTALNFEDTYHYQSQTAADDFIAEELKMPISVSATMPLILVVEDNEEIRNFIVKSLNKTYQVIWAQNGAVALDLALQKLPDVIISDVMMPILNGYQLCNKLKSEISTRHIPVVLLTARSGDLHELDGLKNGADVYLTKPFGIEKLKLIVENLLSLQQNMKDRFTQQFTLEPSLIEIESSDEEFLSKVLKLLEENISNSEFNVNGFAAEIGMSTPVFYKKIKALTGLTVNNFVKSMRLKRAAQLIKQNAGNLSEIAYMVGFNDPKYFSKEFRKQFGKNPSEYGE
ncbi:two-component regulator propeller domain-containing protein [Pedobacter alpinus]|uniref:histidine kinase n=2 Tax=Pedobacter alpinus TaxID=1590643 RepID=A0ABW5TTN1_9SPHI